MFVPIGGISLGEVLFSIKVLPCLFYINKISLIIQKGIDDVSIKSGKCRKNPGDCDFENKAEELCSWSNDLKADFDWLLQQGATPSIGTGKTKSKMKYYSFLNCFKKLIYFKGPSVDQ